MNVLILLRVAFFPKNLSLNVLAQFFGRVGYNVFPHQDARDGRIRSLRHLKGDEGTSDVPIVFIGVLGKTEDKVKGGLSLTPVTSRNEYVRLHVSIYAAISNRNVA
jgi:hypothetical protein